MCPRTAKTNHIIIAIIIKNDNRLLSWNWQISRQTRKSEDIQRKAEDRNLDIRRDVMYEITNDVCFKNVKHMYIINKRSQKNLVWIQGSYQSTNRLDHLSCLKVVISCYLYHKANHFKMLLSTLHGTGNYCVSSFDNTNQGIVMLFKQSVRESIQQVQV